MTVRGVRLHCRRERALGDYARIKEGYRDEVGSGAKRRVGSAGDADPFVARESCRAEWSKTILPF